MQTNTDPTSAPGDEKKSAAAASALRSRSPSPKALKAAPGDEKKRAATAAVGTNSRSTSPKNLPSGASATSYRPLAREVISKW